MQPYNLTDLLYPFQQLTEDVVIYLPRTSDVRQLANKCSEGSKTTVMHYCMEGASKVGLTDQSGMSTFDQTIGDLCILRCFCISLSMHIAK